MLCEQCAREVKTAACPSCGGAILMLGNFCYLCGHPIEHKSAAGIPAEEDGDVDFSARILCSDGTCIGIINEQGVCKVCGKPYAPESSG